MLGILFNIIRRQSLQLCPIQIFEKLQREIDPKVLEERTRAALEKEHEQYKKAQRRFGDLVGDIMDLGPRILSSLRLKCRLEPIRHYPVQYLQYEYFMQTILGKASLQGYSIPF